MHIAHEEGLIRNTSAHAGIRAPVNRPHGDVKNDKRCGFEIITARAIDRIGIQGVIDKLKQRVGDSKVYISVDIDVLDPAYAPGECPLVAEDRIFRDSSSVAYIQSSMYRLHRVDHLGRKMTDQVSTAATGTAEPGGWTTRELLSILDGLSGLQVVGADVGM